MVYVKRYFRRCVGWLFDLRSFVLFGGVESQGISERLCGTFPYCWILYESRCPDVSSNSFTEGSGQAHRGDLSSRLTSY